MWIDLRSDTVTRPSPGMREAMARADVGDDVFGEDPSINKLEQRVAELMGKEAAVYIPSGTMSNQLAVKSHTKPGDEVVLERGAHIANNESGAPAVLSGVNLQLLDGTRGALAAAQVERAIRTETMHTPGTALVCIENTHNKASGAIYPIEEMRAVRRVTEARGVRVHLDGARLMNAVVATGNAARAYADCADSVSVCLSKGLGAPVGSVLSGPKDFIGRARRWRKMWGGGMRQAGVLASAGLYALEHNVERLAEDHEKAKRLAAGIARCRGVDLDPDGVETNIVIFRVTDPAKAASLIPALKEEQVLILSVGPQAYRAVTHLDVPPEAIDAAVRAFERVLGTA